MEEYGEIKKSTYHNAYNTYKISSKAFVYNAIRSAVVSQI